MKCTPFATVRSVDRLEHAPPRCTTQDQPQVIRFFYMPVDRDESLAVPLLVAVLLILIDLADEPVNLFVDSAPTYSIRS